MIGLWKPRGRLISYPQSHQSGILLSQDVQRYQRIREKVPTMPKVRLFLKQAKRGSPHIMEPLALHAMGARRSGLTSPSTASVQVLLITINYFTKWIEVVSLSEVTRQQVVKFMWQKLVCRFGLPRTIMSVNGMNFTSRE